jgi:hypothetical protein
MCHVMGYGFGMILGKFRAREFDISKAEGNCLLACECRASERRYDGRGGERIVTGGDATRLDGAFLDSSDGLVADGVALDCI